MTFPGTTCPTDSPPYAHKAEQQPEWTLMPLAILQRRYGQPTAS